MFTNTKCSIYAGQDKVYTESVCLSTDAKPTTGIANGSTCIEMNTGKKFMFNEDSGEWVEVPSSGGGGGGGGGDSDFSTAQVTITNATETDRIGSCFACYNENELGEGSPSMILNMLMIPNGETVVFKVPLYKGTTWWNNPFEAAGSLATVTGSIINNNGNFIITGDGTITIS